MARLRKRIELEDGLKLDLNKLRVREIAQGEPTQRVICWKPRYSGGPRTISLLVWRFPSATRGSMRLLLHSLDQSIELIAARRNFGGVQWYFVCPVQGRRASVLWKPPGAGYFASRQAWGRRVAYRSQFQPWQDRALFRAREIRFRLGGEDFIALDEMPPPRPRGMHLRTYEMQLARLKAFEARHNLYMEKLISRFEKA